MSPPPPFHQHRWHRRNDTHVDPTITITTTNHTQMPHHTTRETWAVALVTLACIVFIVTLALWLFSTTLRKWVHAVGYYAHILWFRCCCLPLSCCWQTSVRWRRYMERRMRALEHNVDRADLRTTSFSIDNSDDGDDDNDDGDF